MREFLSQFLDNQPEIECSEPHAKFGAFICPIMVISLTYSRFYTSNWLRLVLYCALDHTPRDRLHSVFPFLYCAATPIND